MGRKVFFVVHNSPKTYRIIKKGKDRESESVGLKDHSYDSLFGHVAAMYKKALTE